MGIAGPGPLWANESFSLVSLYIWLTVVDHCMLTNLISYHWIILESLKTNGLLVLHSWIGHLLITLSITFIRGKDIHYPKQLVGNNDGDLVSRFLQVVVCFLGLFQWEMLVNYTMILNYRGSSFVVWIISQSGSKCFPFREGLTLWQCYFD